MGALELNRVPPLGKIFVLQDSYPIWVMSSVPLAMEMPFVLDGLRRVIQSIPFWQWSSAFYGGAPQVSIPKSDRHPFDFAGLHVPND